MIDALKLKELFRANGIVVTCIVIDEHEVSMIAECNGQAKFARFEYAPEDELKSAAADMVTLLQHAFKKERK